MDKTLLADLIAFCGIETRFTDAWGNEAEVQEKNLLTLLAAQGFAIDNDELAKEQLLERQLEIWQQVLDPVSVQKSGQDIQVLLKLAISQANQPLQLTLTTEQGQQHQFQLVATEDAELNHVMLLDDEEFQQYQWTLPLQLELGYHQLDLTVEQQSFNQSLIIAPGACYQPAQFKSQKQWGVSVQLYCVRSEQNWGIGDFADLKQLVTHLSAQGADFIGLNPIHALYPAMPESASPYSPSSRRWLNVIYLSVASLPGYAQCQQVKQLTSAPGFIQQLEAVRATEWVDYKNVTALKLPVLKALYHWFSEHQSQHAELAQSFSVFKQQGGESLLQLALYDAIHAHLISQDQHAWGWPVWPEQYQRPDSDEVQAFAKAHADELDFYCYLQFMAREQLAEVQALAKQKGMLIGLYRDLAVGVSEASTEIWGNPDLYCRDASVGAPPDILGPKGQNWGLPPMLPYQMFRQAYRPMIELFRANMQNSGALRIDHVMALLRLWWVPKGAESAGEGAYIYYPIQDLLGILALESQRHQVVVIGEDLGTVPDGIREILAEYGMYSYRVFFFEQAEDGGYISPAHYPVQAMATLTTHDMPTLIGYWHCGDLELGKKVGLYRDDQLPALFASRHQDKQRILDSLHGHAMLRPDFPSSVDQVGMSTELSHSIQRHVAKGASQLLCLQLEDWMEMTQPVNIPGTSDEYPNWRRKLTMTLEQLAGRDDITALLQQLTSLRHA
ncbi:4-alpha-glucanotransferase [Rheinheimera sp.]|uniref:4-alpha-glucanotransferase n=1 Tax=Rheinheimera sp. TaxID=1869214 RepID=UPI003AF4CC27